VVSLAHARAAAALVPDARLEVLRGGHVPWLGNTQRVAALLQDFERSLPVAG
jgi:pimeloyl-ACP methyl ester carboxylesterase